jgi:hypothetical protein
MATSFGSQRWLMINTSLLEPGNTGLPPRYTTADLVHFRDRRGRAQVHEPARGRWYLSINDVPGNVAGNRGFMDVVIYRGALSS